MPALSSSHAVAILAASHAALVSAQSLREQTWGVFAYTVHGDSVPQALPRPQMLTPYGANELHAAGSAFRDRYVAIHGSGGRPSTRIEGISPYLLRSEDIEVVTTDDQPAIASAQAFMQGLYPPLNASFPGKYYDPTFDLANGSAMTFPLDGYQYPRITTVDSMDPRSITVDGQYSCPMHQAANSEYLSSADTQELIQESAAFYNTLWVSALSGAFEESSASYVNAREISEFLDYQLAHNKTLLNHLSADSIGHARAFADRYVYETNGNISSSSSIGTGKVRSIAGRTLASRILAAFDTNVHFRGTDGMMHLVFGGYEPVVALTSLLQLASPQHGNFQSRPVRGASIVFELYSLEGHDNPTYPDPSDLFVRFYLRNGTDSEFQSYPLFGNGPSNDAIPYSEFREQMSGFSLGSTKEWCLQCDSEAVFCSAGSRQGGAGSERCRGLQPAAAGVVGGVITIVALGVFLIIGFLIQGFRKNRTRNSSLGGFKGNSKMASDSDVVFNSSELDNMKADNPHQLASDNPYHVNGATIVHGHERMDSWDLGQPRTGSTPSRPEDQVSLSPFDDEYREEWQHHSVSKPAVARESV
ncbi:putative histidine acid phosphatase [Aspergillus taichungensis]|uniref:Putative histidine acid phosphatase n=1 Tax=Aspergillus taichungensis TaxID=482145 RepID=A0A2J5HPL2_9EURO|nr:putative histidine acid phosphatase [Aspergillus taichungensis]